MNEAQLDFCLEMYALDHPKEFRFQRPGKHVTPTSEVRAAWDRVLEGAAREAREPKMPRAILRRMTEALGGALKTITGGKNVNH